MVLIIIVNYNGWEDTLKCISSLLNLLFEDYAVIIVDNKSTDDSVVKISNGLNGLNISYTILSEYDNIVYKQKECYIICAPFNGGFAYGNNIGIRASLNSNLNFNYIWLLNNDTIVDKESLSHLVNYANKSDDRIGIWGCKLLYIDKPSVIQGIGGRYNRFSAKAFHVGAFEIDEGQYLKCNSDYVIGASMFVRKNFILDIGLMTEDYFLYFEELDWILRSRRKSGWLIDYVPNAIVYHKDGGSTKVKNKLISEIADICQLKNRILFTYRFYPFCLFSVIPMCFLTILKRFIFGDFNRANVLFANYCLILKKIICEKR